MRALTCACATAAIAAAAISGVTRAEEIPYGMTEQGPVWVCFDGNHPPSDERLAEIFEATMDAAYRYNLTGRWPGAQGDPITLTWSFMPDGVNIGQSSFDIPQQGALASNLFATLDGQFPSRAAWVSQFQASFDRWEALTGINFVRLTPGGNDFDDGAVAGTAGDGVNRGDIRIGGRCIDGAGGFFCDGTVDPTPGGTLAYNQFPGNGGDMVMDTAQNWFGGGTELFLRNTVMHELGHGVGLQHVCPINQSKLMEPNITNNFDGPQHDDLRAAQRHYGDPFEMDDSAAASNNLGGISAPFPIAVGAIPAPAITNSSIVSLDANAEEDFYSFTTSAADLLTVSVTPPGLNYDSSTQNADGTCNSGSFIDSRNMADLAFQILDTDMTTVLTTVDGQGLGGVETLDSFSLGAAGTYFVRVYETAGQSQSQLYSMTLDVNEPPVAACMPHQASADGNCCISVSVADVDGGSLDPNGVGDIDVLAISMVDGVSVGLQQTVEICEPGDHTVTLFIRDLSGETDSCVATVTVVDDTPPDVTCPADITVECTENGGTPADDPQLAGFFAVFAATDNCDPSPTAAHDAPAFFPLGDTVVTYAATDASGNVGSCMATVTVADTTPPEITVSLNREVLWPPNHKMVDIEAAVEVTDICDPNPTFVLVSITSNEPDEGIGDGDFPNDIQEADFGTADVEFQLRAERAGPRDGRIYTIDYLASDMSGNTTPNTVFVRVPHNRHGRAVAGIGFNGDGTGLESVATLAFIVIPGDPEFDAGTIDVDGIYVGNQLGVCRARSIGHREVTGDQWEDLVIEVDVASIAAISSLSGEETVGIYYRTTDADFVVANLFALGTPIAAGAVEVGVEVEVDVEGEVEVGEDPALARPTLLYAPTPNPFRATSRLAYEVTTDAAVDVSVFSVAGRRVRTLVRAHLAAGEYGVEWDGRNAAGAVVQPGVYFYRVDVGGDVHVVRMTYLR